VALINKRKL
jgi:hypothetical protein